jgi:hypothetical protein
VQEVLAGAFEPPYVLFPPELAEPGARGLQGLDQLGPRGSPAVAVATYPLAELELAMDAAAEPGGPLVVVAPTG